MRLQTVVNQSCRGLSLLTISNDVGEEIHLGVLLGKLEGLVHTVTDDQELDRGGEVPELDEEPGHHLGPLGTPRLLHDPNRVLRVVEPVQVEPDRRVVVPGSLVRHHRLLVLPVTLLSLEEVVVDDFPVVASLTLANCNCILGEEMLGRRDPIFVQFFSLI